MGFRRLEDIQAEVLQELDRAMDDYDKFNSAHEGYAVIKEEFEELWDEIKKKKEKRDYRLMRLEATQLAAMAVRFIHDIC